MSSLLNRLLIALAIAITVIALSIKVVPSGTVGVVSSFGVVQSPPRQPGLNFLIPLAQTIQEISIQTKAIPEEFTVQTRDSQQIKVTATATYAINPPNAPAIIANIGRNEESVRSVVIQPVLVSSVKRVVTGYAMQEVIENQARISGEIREDIIKELDKQGYVNFRDFAVTGFVLDTEVQKSIEQKQIAIQEKQRKMTELETAQIEAQRLKTLDAVLSDRILLKQAIDKWDGSSMIPPMAGRGNMSLLLSPKK
jgi:regulator of protease activity HflC (stomatin/prohibitin superfamily)